MRQRRLPLVFASQPLKSPPVDRQTLELATTLPGNDFEYNVLIACAVRAGVDAIVTRNGDDFVHRPTPVLTPAELLARL